MSSRLIFTKLIRDNVFDSEFRNLTQNNVIDFKKSGQHSNQGMIVIYGPNGTGKTSLVKVLEGKEPGCEFSFDYEGQTYEDNDDGLIHCIHDQNSRNIIQGNTEDFLLGDNIRKEYELKEKIETGFTKVYKSTLQKTLKDTYKVKKQSANLIAKNPNGVLATFAKDIVNAQSVGKKIDKMKFVDFIESLEHHAIVEHDEKLLNYVCENYIDNKSILSKVLDIGEVDLVVNDGIKQIEENEIAIGILNKYCDRTDCIVCETQGINPKDLAEKKTKKHKQVIKSLKPQAKKIVENIVNSSELRTLDLLDIRRRLIEFVGSGDLDIYRGIVGDIHFYIGIAYKKIENLFIESISEELISSLREYSQLLKAQPEISDEEVLFIQKIVSENIRKDIELKRDTENDNNFKLLISGNPLLGEERIKLKLSNGEQNFISIAFELLKARNVDAKIILLDDPISSFDSIYKNKIAFCIIKFLEKKKQIIMSHNVDLVRLLHHQLKGCFNLYLLNNSEDGVNGFIEINNDELDMLLDISTLLRTVRTSILKDVCDEKAYMFSMIPFLRGYANIVGDSVSYKALSKLMHGYESVVIDLTAVYNKLLGETSSISNAYNVSVSDLLSFNISDVEQIVDIEKYPLLNKALVHTLNYLYLRLTVESKLVSRYNITISGNMQLNQIIRKAFNKPDDLSHRIFFTSRKTLLNEFNHFEGNMNIFQPAIDISDQALILERKGVVEYVNAL